MGVRLLMDKRFLNRIGNVILSLIIIFLICSSLVIAAEQTKTLVFSSHNPPAGLNLILEEGWFAEIEK